MLLDYWLYNHYNEKDIGIFERDVEMFEKDVKRVSICIEMKDYYSAMEYAMLVKEKYKSQERKYFEDIIKYVKKGDYNAIEKILVE